MTYRQTFVILLDAVESIEHVAQQLIFAIANKLLQVTTLRHILLLMTLMYIRELFSLIL